MATTPAAPKTNRLGLAVLDYRGGKTTLCAGCGHNAISERIIDALYEMGVQPERVAKLSGIGCSSKSPAYFLARAHSFNCVYGLTKGQFSATADLGSKLKTGVINELPPIDTCELAISLGATFVGRSFSGDKRQLHAMLKAAISHKGTVLLDVISPCVTFNDHEGSTKSYKYAKDHDEPLQEINFIPAFEDIAIEYDPGTTVEVTMHDGSRLRLRKLEEDYDPRNKIRAITRLNEAKEKDEMLTGVLYVNTHAPTFLDMLNITREPLATLPASVVRPGREVLEQVMEELR